MLSISLTDIPGGGAHNRLQLELCLQLGGGGQVEYPVVVDQSHQGPGLGGDTQVRKHSSTVGGERCSKYSILRFLEVEFQFGK